MPCCSSRSASSSISSAERTSPGRCMAPCACRASRISQQVTLANSTERAKKGSSTCRMMSGILPRWFVAHPFAPAFQIWTTRKGKWSEDLGRVLEYQAPTLSPDRRYPLERRCDAVVSAELAEGRSVMAYYEQSVERDVGARLMQILAQHNP